MQDTHSVQHYVMNALLYLPTIKEKYIAVYNEFISQLCIYGKCCVTQISCNRIIGVSI